jgi:tRNA A37 threonylcarbamoyladenosine dehydratase
LPVNHDLASELAAAATRRDVVTFRPLLLDAGSPDTSAALAALLAESAVVVIDELRSQLEQLTRVRAPGEELEGVRLDEAVARVLGGHEPAAFGTWVLYPWNRTLVHVLPEPLHRELRFDRNRYAITVDEQRRLAGLCVAVAGLSVGRAVVSTLAHEGIGGELRLADFDVLDLPNLNRVSGGVADVGLNKVVLAAREIAELDPYIRVVAFPHGVMETNIDEFLAGVDVVVDECDDLGMKLHLRERARTASCPVVMATSHRGMLDIERFDLEPQRPPFHGLLSDVTSSKLRALTTKQKVPYVIRILDPASLTDRAAASLVEVKQTVSTWPQLASDVALGGAMVANAVRRIALGGLTGSGRFYADLDDLTRDGRQVALPAAPTPRTPVPSETPIPTPPRAGPMRAGREDIYFIVECACSAPSGGNMQPWWFEAEPGVIRAWIDPKRSSLMDFKYRGSLLALGAALEAAEIGARAIGIEPTARLLDTGPVWELALERSSHARDEEAVKVLWERCCNRRTGLSRPIARNELVRVARAGAPVHATVLSGERLAELGAALGELDRVRFLSSRLRRGLMEELRFTTEAACASRDGIDVASLELDDADLAVMDVLRAGAGMQFLAALDIGWGLRNAARDAFTQSAGAIVLRAAAADRTAVVNAGRGLMRLWLEATRRKLAVHPCGSPILLQRLVEDPDSLEKWERTALTNAADRLSRVLELERARPVMLVLRISRSDPPAVRSLRRPINDVLRYAE